MPPWEIGPVGSEPPRLNPFPNLDTMKPPSFRPQGVEPRPDSAAPTPPRQRPAARVPVESAPATRPTPPLEPESESEPQRQRLAEPPRPRPSAGGPPNLATIGIQGFDIKKLNRATENYRIELPDSQGRWVKLHSIAGTGKSPVFGRSADPTGELMKSVALKHVRFENTGKGLEVQPYETVNGVYRRLTGPVELKNGAWLRIGNYVFKFQDGKPGAAVAPRVVEGECLVARDLPARGELLFLRPDGEFGSRFPILKATPTVLGRGGTDAQGREAFVDVPLADDRKVSPRHAQITWRGDNHDRPMLEDLDSKSGTWVRVEGRSPAADGDLFWMGELYLRVVLDD